MRRAHITCAKVIPIVLLRHHHACASGAIDSTLRIYNPTACSAHRGVYSNTLLSNSHVELIWAVAITEVRPYFQVLYFILPCRYSDTRKNIKHTRQLTLWVNPPRTEHSIIAIISTPVIII